MADTNQLLANDFLLRSIHLDRFSVTERNAALDALTKLEKELLAKLREPERLTSFDAARTEALLKQTRASIATAFKKLSNDRKASLIDVARLEKTFVAQALDSGIAAGIASVVTDDQTLKRLVDGTLIQGSPAVEWWSRQSTSLVHRFEDVVRSGVLSGEGIDTIARRIRGTKATGYQDGIMSVSRREAAALARTSVQAVANKARLSAFDENSDVVKKVQQRSTLDSRTTYICQSYSGLVWNLVTNEDGSVTYQPDGHSKSFVSVFNGVSHAGPPRHWQCRSTIVPVTASWDELAGKTIKRPGKKPVEFQDLLRSSLKKRGFTEDQISRITSETQSSMNGQVSRELDFDTWLRDQKESIQVDALGSERWKLWKDGRIATLRDLTNNQGRPLTLAELSQKASSIVPKEEVLEIPVKKNVPIYPNGTPKEAEQWIEDSFAEASEEIKERIRRNDPIYSIKIAKIGANYQRATQTISIETSGFSGNVSAFRHEYGHHVDHTAKKKGALEGTPNVLCDYASVSANTAIKNDKKKILSAYREAAKTYARAVSAPTIVDIQTKKEFEFVRAVQALSDDSGAAFLQNVMAQRGKGEAYKYFKSTYPNVTIEELAFACQQSIILNVSSKKMLSEAMDRAKELFAAIRSPKFWDDMPTDALDKLDYLESFTKRGDFPFTWYEMKKMGQDIDKRAKLISAVMDRDFIRFARFVDYDSSYLGEGSLLAKRHYAVIQDMVESVTDGTYGSGHGSSYLNARKIKNFDGETVWQGASSELFANWFDLVNGKDRDIWSKVLRFFMPETIAEFERIVDIVL